MLDTTTLQLLSNVQQLLLLVEAKAFQLDNNNPLKHQSLYLCYTIRSQVYQQVVSLNVSF